MVTAESWLVNQNVKVLLIVSAVLAPSDYNIRHRIVVYVRLILLHLYDCLRSASTLLKDSAVLCEQLMLCSMSTTSIAHIS